MDGGADCVSVGVKEADIDGFSDGIEDGRGADGCVEGTNEGKSDGIDDDSSPSSVVLLPAMPCSPMYFEGGLDGTSEGKSDGKVDGKSAGAVEDGSVDGIKEGVADSVADGATDGDIDGWSVAHSTESPEANCPLPPTITSHSAILFLILLLDAIMIVCTMALFIALALLFAKFRHASHGFVASESCGAPKNEREIERGESFCVLYSFDDTNF